MAVSRYLIDALTRHQVFLERLKAGTVRDFDAVLAKLEAAIQGRLAASNQPMAELSRVALDRMIEDIISAEERLAKPWQAELTSGLQDLAGHEAGFDAKLLDEATVADLVIHPVSAADAWQAAKDRPVQAAGKLLEPWIKEWTSKQLGSVETVIRNAHAQGWTMDQTTRAVKGTKAANYADGLVAGIRRNVEAMVRTSIQHVSNTARSAIFEANPDIVTGERWIATLDLATCQRCASLDQEVFPFGKGPRPPAHVSCRCLTVSEMAESVALFGSGMRASKGAAGGEQVPASQPYFTWLRNQPASFQDEAIGATRGALLRRGGLDSATFARLNLGRNFQPLSLAEMKTKAPEAFSKAGIQ